MLRETKQILRGPGGTVLPVIGMLPAILTYHNKTIQEPLFVIQSQSSSLLSKKACVELGIISRVDEIKCNSVTPDFKSEFPELFTGLGKLKEEFHISLSREAKPICLHAPRKIPHPLVPKVKQEIESMVRQGVISPVTQPTKWCSGIVPVPKDNGKVRICVDLTELNKAVEREIHPMASVDESLAKLHKSKFFTKLDANSGFWQLPLDAESRLLTTFITPFGRFCFNRVPFGISSAPEIFQRVMSKILEGLDGVICQMDDVLLHAETLEELNRIVRAALARIRDSGFTLNEEKCQFSKTKMRFLGHVIDGNGIHADPQKMAAIVNFPAPTNITELQRFMGMVNQLGKFVPGLANLNEPLRQLLQKKSLWCWGETQQRSFQQIKDILVSPQVLAPYDPARPTIVVADSSNAGIGAALLQMQENGERRPVCYASRSLTETEQRYAVIEKEALAAVWACEKFSEYVLGLNFLLETDHKPLVSLLQNKELAKLPFRIQRFRLRLMRYSPVVQYVAGKNQITADALSRAPVSSPDSSDVSFINEVEYYATESMSILPATAKRLQEICNAQKADPECRQIREYCIRGWPAYMPQSSLLQQYWENRAHLAIVNDILLYDERLVIPSSMRLEMLNCIHQGHLGITKCRARARVSVWWPGLSKHIEELVSKCSICAKESAVIKEPLLPSSFPSRPWERLGMDLFMFKSETYLIVVDYYSRWVEVKQLSDQTSAGVITVLKELFSVHGIPEIVISDNGPQFSGSSFHEFACEYNFTHVTSSPKYPQGNGESERAVRTVKSLLKKNEDFQSALLIYRSTPLQNGLSPSELLMGRKLRTLLPTLPSVLCSKVGTDDLQIVKKKEEAYRDNQRGNFNIRHRVRELPTLSDGAKVWIRDQSRYGEVVSHTNQPRSYLVKTPQGILRRNRNALVATPNDDHIPRVENSVIEPNADPPRLIFTPEKLDKPDSTNIVQTRSGRVVIAPKKLNL